MKKIFVLLLLAVSTTTFAQWQTVKGNGNLKKEERKVEAFTGIQLQGSINVELTYGTSNTITVEADDNLLPYIETYVENGNLVVKTRKNAILKSNERLKVYASLTKLTGAVVSGSGNLFGTGNFSNGGKTDIRISGSGNIGLGVDALSEVNITISGSGNITLKGNNCNNITASISGSGNIDCSNIQTNDIFAKVSGSGDIRVNALRSIDAKVSGSGNIYYKGGASQVSIKSSGSGKIIKAR